MSISPTTPRSSSYNSSITPVTTQAHATVTSSETSSTSAQSTNTSNKSNSFSVWSTSTAGIDQTGPQKSEINSTQAKFQALSAQSQQAATANQGFQEAGKAMIAGIQNIVGVVSKVLEGAKNKTPGQEGDNNNRGKDTRVAQEPERRGKTDLFRDS